MMISTQTICMSSPRIPQPGIGINSTISLSALRRREGLKWSSSGFQKGRGYGTVAIKQASSFFSSAEDAFDDGVPAKDTGVSDLIGTKPVELVDPISPTQLVSTIDDQLPPLLSMVTDGLPSLQRSKYEHESAKTLQLYVERYPDVISLDSYCRVGLAAGSYMYPRIISLNRLIAISINYALLFMVDDIFFDTRDEFLWDQCGISHDICGSSQNIQEYLDHLDAVFSQQVQPSNSAPLIETMVWESGRDLLELSNPEWFKNYVVCVKEHHCASITSHADIVQGHNLSFQDLESYTTMRAGNVGGKFAQLMIEFANDTYIPSILKADPYFKKVTTTTSIHIGFVNDVFSYHKESSLEQNPRNFITVLMECEGKPFVQTMHRAIGLVNTYACVLMDLEAKAWNSTLQNHLRDIKALIAGNIYGAYVNNRYRHPDSVFLELRDMHD